MSKYSFRCSLFISLIINCIFFTNGTGNEAENKTTFSNDVGYTQN